MISLFVLLYSFIVIQLSAAGCAVPTALLLLGILNFAIWSFAAGWGSAARRYPDLW